MFPMINIVPLRVVIAASRDPHDRFIFIMEILYLKRALDPGAPVRYHDILCQ